MTPWELFLYGLAVAVSLPFIALGFVIGCLVVLSVLGSLKGEKR